MKMLVSLLVLFSFVFGSCNTQTSDYLELIKQSLSDTDSNISIGALSSEQQEVKNHLHKVVTHLSQKDIAHLSPDLQENRVLNIALLQNYLKENKFPENYNYHNDLAHCPISMEAESPCPIGYLIQKTGGEHLLSEIKAFYQYALNPQMESPELINWVKNSGFTLEECGMIQPVPAGSERLNTPLSSPTP